MATLDSQFIEHGNETKHVKEINDMQIALVKNWESDIADNDERFAAWTARYSGKFRDTLDRILDREESATFWEDYKNEEFRTAFMQEMEKELYETF